MSEVQAEDGARVRGRQGALRLTLGAAMARGRARAELLAPPEDEGPREAPGAHVPLRSLRLPGVVRAGGVRPGVRARPAPPPPRRGCRRARCAGAAASPARAPGSCGSSG